MVTLPEVLATEPAGGRAAHPAAATSTRVAYRSVAVGGGATTMTGLVHLPPGPVPRGGWPVVTYGHMTTGGSDRSAPSAATDDHPELRRMTQGDALVGELLARGVVVLRPDYEGIGGPGPHPYLVGRSLARATLDLLAAARRDDERLGTAWVSAGHSEGAVAALSTAAASGGRMGDARLCGVAAFTPVTRMDLTIGACLRSPVVVPGTRVVVPLVALMASGLATVDPVLAALLRDDGLSRRAAALWPHLEERSLTELARPDSWGGLAPARVLGVRGAELRGRLLDGLRREDVRHLRLPPGVPVRVDAARLDEVAPLPLTVDLVRGYAGSGVPVTFRRWWASHSTVMAPGRAPLPAAEWIVARLASGGLRGRGVCPRGGRGTHES